MSKDYDKIETAISDLGKTSEKLSGHIEYIREDFADIKSELKSIAKILETQIRHSEELKHMKEKIDKNEVCNLKSGERDIKIEHLEEKVKLMNSRFSKIAFVLFGGIISIVVKLTLSHF